MKKNIIKDKSFLFAIDIIRFCKKLTDKQAGFIIVKQLLKSGTAIGALVREAEMAESKKDFIHKMSIALKEANETLYWLELIKATSLQNIDQLLRQCTELVKLLVSIIKSTKRNIA